MKKITFLIFFTLYTLHFTVFAYADTVTDNAFQYLKNNQDSTGKITTGFSAPSQWSAIAFSANNNDISKISQSGGSSLLNFLTTDLPSSPSATTDWESRILAIVDSGYDPTNFGGINYVQNMESLVSNNQIGGKCSLNDSIFGLMAEIAAGPAANNTIKQTTLNFILSQEDPSTGGFSFSLDASCSFPSPASADITGAAAVALMHAKSSGMSASGLDGAIASVSSYLTNPTNIDSDGGYGYFGSSDTDTTGWVLQGLNALGLEDSSQAQAAKNYLESQASSSDGGIMDFDYSSNSNKSNSTTTAQALIGLLGKDWILKIYDPSTALQTGSPTVTPTPTTSVTPSVTPTDTPTPTPSSSNSSSSSPTTPTPTPTVTPTNTPTPVFFATTQNNDNTVSPTISEQNSGSNAQTPKVSQEVLGTSTNNSNSNILAIAFIIFGILSLGVFSFQIWKKN